MIIWIVFGILLVIAGTIIYFVFKTAPPVPPSLPPSGAFTPGSCKCLADVRERSPSSGPIDPEYQSVEARDNKTFCGFEQDGYRWACKPTDCTPSCT